MAGKQETEMPIDRAQLDTIKHLRFVDENGTPEVVVDIAWMD